MDLETPGLVEAVTPVDEDYLVVRVNRVWLDRVMWKVKSVLALVILMGGGTITTTTMNLLATLTGQEKVHETHVEEMTVVEVEDLCTNNGFSRSLKGSDDKLSSGEKKKRKKK
jgi:copper homeostasis protein CutC